MVPPKGSLPHSESKNSHSPQVAVFEKFSPSRKLVEDTMYQTCASTKSLTFLAYQHCYFNLGKVVFEKNLVMRASIKEAREPCVTKKNILTIIFHNKTKLTQ